MSENLTIGKLGEELASLFLKQNQYRVIARNYQKPWGEIDIIAFAKDNTLVFIEVKTLQANNPSGLKPEDHLTKSKLTKLQKTCLGFANQNPKLINKKKGWRLDLITIILNNFVNINPSPLLTDYKNYCIINHYQNISV